MTDETEGKPSPAAEPAAESAPAESEQAKTTEQETPKEPEPEAETSEGEESSPERKRPSRSERMKRRMQAMATELEGYRSHFAQQMQNDGKTDTAPKEDEFNGDIYAYERARVAWEARQAVREEFQERDQREQAKEQARRAAEASEEFFDKAEEIKTRLPDFDKAIETFYGNGGRFSPVLQEELRESDKGPALAYHLAKNPHIAAELNGLSARDVAREIGRLETQISVPSPRKQTKAPEPFKSPSGGSAPPINEQTGPDDMEAYVKWRMKDKGS